MHGYPAINRRILDHHAAADECWLLRANADGYVRIGARGTLAHRIAWEVAHHQQVPTTHQVHHLCRHRSCVNPRHLQLLTITEHQAIHHPPTDTSQPPTGQCRHGHDWATHAKLTTQHRWICAECLRAAGRRHDAKRRAA